MPAGVSGQSAKYLQLWLSLAMNLLENVVTIFKLAISCNRNFHGYVTKSTYILDRDWKPQQVILREKCTKG